MSEMEMVYFIVSASNLVSLNSFIVYSLHFNVMSSFCVWQCLLGLECVWCIVGNRASAWLWASVGLAFPMYFAYCLHLCVFVECFFVGVIVSLCVCACECVCVCVCVCACVVLETPRAWQSCQTVVVVGDRRIPNDFTANVEKHVGDPRWDRKPPNI